jgi:hypothetical protein
MCSLYLLQFKYSKATVVKEMLPTSPIIAEKEIFCKESGGSPDSTYDISR